MANRAYRIDRKLNMEYSISKYMYEYKKKKSISDHIYDPRKQIPESPIPAYNPYQIATQGFRIQ